MRVVRVEWVTGLVHLGVTRQYPGSRRDDIGLDSPIVRRTAAAEVRHLLRVVRKGTGRVYRVTRIRTGIVIVLCQRGVTVVAGSIILAGAHGDGVLRRGRRGDRAEGVENAVAIGVTRVAGREDDGRVRMGPDVVVQVRAVGGVGALLARRPP